MPAPVHGRNGSRSVPTLVATALGATALGAASMSATAIAPSGPLAAGAEGHAERGTGHVRTSTRVPAPPASARRQVLGAPVRVLTSAASYTVRAGDTVSHIAARLGTTVAAVVAANGLDSRAFIREGQVLAVPSGDAAPAPTAQPSQQAASAGRHTVVGGDTVGAIAARYGTSTAAVVAANGLDARAFVRVGQVLAIPGADGGSVAATPATPATPATGAYTVTAGDTLSHIAARAGTTVDALRAANPGLDAAGSIRIGETVQVPGRAAASTPLPNSFAGRTYPDATVQAATANRDVLVARGVPSREDMQQIVADTARSHGVDPALAQAISFQESGFDMRAVSPANAVGAMQVIPSSGEWAAMLAGRPIDLLDARDNALAGVLILRAHAATGVDEATVIAAYYQGMGGVLRDGMYPDTRRYVANVQTLTARFR